MLTFRYSDKQGYFFDVLMQLSNHLKILVSAFIQIHENNIWKMLENSVQSVSRTASLTYANKIPIILQVVLQLQFRGSVRIDYAVGIFHTTKFGYKLVIQNEKVLKINHRKTKVFVIKP
jgi:hypothetical protein